MWAYLIESVWTVKRPGDSVPPPIQQNDPGGSGNANAPIVRVYAFKNSTSVKMTGSVVLQGPLTYQTNLESGVAEFNPVQAGTYIVTVNDLTGGKYTRKIVVQANTIYNLTVFADLAGNVTWTGGESLRAVS